MDIYNDLDFMFSPEFENLRGEAISLYEQCLAEQGTQYLAQFIEDQIAVSPPPLVLLQRIADDLQQRLFSLQSHHFDVRKYVIETLRDTYNTDAIPYMPADALSTFHCFDATPLLAAVDAEEQPEDARQLRQILETSRNIGKQLQLDIDITTDLLKMVNDWLFAFSIRHARDEWTGLQFGQAKNDIIQ